MGRTCLGDAVGYLLIETIGRGKIATKIGEGVNLVKVLAVNLFLQGMFVLDPFAG